MENIEPKRLEAKAGLMWIKKGYALFMKAPLLWIVLVIICFVGAAALSNIPVIGEPLTSLLMPVVVIGLMAGCRSLEKGEELELAHLLSGFQKQTSNLVTLGGIALVSQYLIFGAMILLGGRALVGILTGNQPADPAVFEQTIAGSGSAIMLGSALFTVLLMAMQFAPMLVYFRDVPPIKAMKLSLNAFIRNVAPMFVYGMAFMLMALLASMPMMLGWLILMPLVFTTMYISFCDIFPESATQGAG